MASPKSNKKNPVKKQPVKRKVVNITVKGKTGGGKSIVELSSASAKGKAVEAFKDVYELAKGGVGDYNSYVEMMSDVNRVNTPTVYDNINPNHYKNASIETIEMMIRIWGKESTALHCEMTAFKYRSRIGTKPGQSIKDELSKIEWYENKALELRGLPLKTLIKQ